MMVYNVVYSFFIMDKNLLFEYLVFRLNEWKKI